MQQTKFLILSIGILFHTTSLFAATLAPADKIKAAYIYQLTKFVTWPENSATVDTAFTICVLGKESISNELETLNSRQTEGRIIRINHPKTVNETVDCNILYIAESEKRQLQTILNFTYNRPTLTVSSLANFTAIGGIIGFVIINNKVRLEINRTPARNIGIKLSAKLLEVASLIRNSTAGETKP